MGIGLGVGINRSNYAQGIFGAYATRVVADGGVVEAGACVDAVSGLLLSASLLLIPSGYKGGKLYAEIPTNGNGDLTWTRGGDGFRTNASGLIQRVPWNLLTWSEDLTNASWSKTNATITGDNTLAPNGTLTADLVSFSTSSGYVLKTQSVSPATQYTFSAYFKNNTFASGETILFRLSDGVIAPAIATINVIAKTATYNTNPSAWTNLSGTIEQLSNDWFRVSVTATSVNGGSGWIEVVTNGFTKSCFVWGVQLVTSSTAQTYLPTTDRLNFPRLSYMYGSCPAVLLEPQRTNLCLRSEEFDNASWGKVNTTITANVSATLDPSGGNNADKFIATTTNSTHNIGQTGFASTAYSFSVYAKAAEETSMSLWLRGNTVRAEFNLSNGTISNITVTSATITSVGNGWYRCSVYDSTPGTTATIYGRGGGTYAGNGTDGFYLYGAQLEAGAYPTTYISTTSATATRVADSFSRSNIYTNGLISASGGTWFVELRNNIVYTRDANTRFGIGDTTALNTNALFFIGDIGNRINLWKAVSGAVTGLYTTTTDTTKFAFKWNGTSCDIFANGTKVVTATSFTPTNMENLIGALGVPIFIQSMALFPTPLTDTQCQTLTTI
jgi:hypothetical protein